MASGSRLDFYWLKTASIITNTAGPVTWRGYHADEGPTSRVHANRETT